MENASVTRTWRIGSQARHPVNIPAVYYRFDPASGLIEFKDADNKVVYALPKSVVTSIGRLDVDKPELADAIPHVARNQASGDPATAARKIVLGNLRLHQ